MFCIKCLSFQKVTLVPQTPLVTAQVLKEENETWMEVQVSSHTRHTGLGGGRGGAVNMQASHMVGKLRKTYQFQFELSRSG